MIRKLILDGELWEGEQILADVALLEETMPEESAHPPFFQFQLIPLEKLCLASSIRSGCFQAVQ